MSYFLRQDKKNGRVYLQMYGSYWDKDLKQSRCRSIKDLGYAEIPDPVAHYREIVNKENQKRKDEVDNEIRPRAFKEADSET